MIKMMYLGICVMNVLMEIGVIADGVRYAKANNINSKKPSGFKALLAVLQLIGLSIIPIIHIFYFLLLLVVSNDEEYKEDLYSNL